VFVSRSRVAHPAQEAVSDAARNWNARVSLSRRVSRRVRPKRRPKQTQLRKRAIQLQTRDQGAASAEACMLVCDFAGGVAARDC